MNKFKLKSDNMFIRYFGLDNSYDKVCLGEYFVTDYGTKKVRISGKELWAIGAEKGAFNPKSLYSFDLCDVEEVFEGQNYILKGI